jgi:hypothetical protein
LTEIINPCELEFPGSCRRGSTALKIASLQKKFLAMTFRDFFTEERVVFGGIRCPQEFPNGLIIFLTQVEVRAIVLAGERKS